MHLAILYGASNSTEYVVYVYYIKLLCSIGSRTTSIVCTSIRAAVLDVTVAANSGDLNRCDRLANVSLPLFHETIIVKKNLFHFGKLLLQLVVVVAVPSFFSVPTTFPMV